MLTEKDRETFWQELDAVCQWEGDDIEEAPERAKIMADIQTKTFSPEVLDEAMDCLYRDWVWLDPKMKKIWLHVMAENGRLDEYDPELEARTLTIGRKRKTKTVKIDGKTYIHP